MTDRELALFLHESSLAGGVDFHLHSNFSDGYQSPEELVAEVFEKELTAFSLTDHDNMDGIPRARKAVSGRVRFIPGVELSSRFEDQEIHILGYFTEDQPAGMMEYLDLQVRERVERNLAMIHKLNQLGYAIRPEDLASYGNDKTLPGRVHMALWLVEHGGLHSIGEAFARLLKEGAPAFVYRKRHLAGETIRLIRESGGVAVIAHPQQYGWCDLPDSRTPRLFRERLSRLKAAGLSGIECFHGQATGKESAFMQELALEAGLICTAGSDSHGRAETHTAMYDGRSL